MKSLREISLPITEQQYREDGAMHYSTLSDFSKGGFHCIEHLGEKKESPSLLFGSVVDTLITGTPEEFENTYFVTDVSADSSDTLINVTKSLFSIYKDSYPTLEEIPDENVIAVLNEIDYGRAWKADTRISKLRKAGSDYYKLLYITEGKTVISSEMYSEAMACVRALHEAPATKHLFAADNPFEPNIERLYQLKFSREFNGVRYSCMADLLYVDHEKKILVFCDLKTSSKYEDDFYKSFVEWNYHIQARLYWRIIRATMDDDDYFKDFTLTNCHFIVVNKRNLVPLVWVFEDTQKTGELTYGKERIVKFRDPFELGEELSKYLKAKPSVPDGISLDKPNSLIEHLNTL